MKKPDCLLAVIIFTVFSCQTADSTILWVPDEFATIQSAVNATVSGDTVLIRSGTYRQNLAIPNRDITIGSEYLLNGDTTLISQCILRPPFEPNGGRCVMAERVDTTKILRLIGLTIRGGVFSGERFDVSGGILAYNRNFDILSCVIDSTFGTAIHLNNGTLITYNCNFSVNGSSYTPSIFGLDSVNAQISLSDIVNNFSWDSNDAVSLNYIYGSKVAFSSCRICSLGWSTNYGIEFVQPSGFHDTLAVSNCQILNNRFNNFFAYGGGQACKITFEGNTFSNNETIGGVYTSENYQNTSSFYCLRNNFINNRAIPQTLGGNLLSLGGGTRTYIVEQNLFLNNFGREQSCAYIGTTNSTTLSFRHNYIIGNSNDAFLNPPGGAIRLFVSLPDQFRDNVIYGNRGLAIFKGVIGGGVAHAENNYWGSATGPYDSLNNPGGQGDTVDSRVSYSPWATDSLFTDAVEPSKPIQPADFLIGRAYPNPFNSEVTLEYAITKELEIRLEIFDLLGRKIETLVNEKQTVGIREVHWNASAQASGLYFARLSSANSSQQHWLQKLVLIK